MQKYIAFVLLLLAVVFSGCEEGTDKSTSLPGDKPPEVNVEIAGEQYGAKLGTYCWGPNADGVAECVDTAGPVDLLEDEKPIKVKAGEKISIEMDYTPKPDEIHFTQMLDEDDDGEEIALKDNTFTAPEEKGLYYYDYGVWWTNEDVSQADAFYAFKLEVD